MEMIVTHGLSKTFQSGKQAVEAVKKISLSVREGEIYGFLGPNGAGKTTTMRMLTTLMRPSAGTASVVGLDLFKSPKKIRQKIGYVSQKGGCYELATGYENLVLQGRLYGLTRAAAQESADKVVSLFRMEEYCRRKVTTYSGGQRRHVDLGMGIMHRPKLLFLDEPTTGLDPASRAEFWAAIRSLRADGMTIFLTTHYLDEADSLCDTICIMDHGEVAANGTALELKRQIAGDLIEIGMDMGLAGRAELLLRGRGDIREVRRTESSLRLYVDAGETALPELLPAFVSAGIPITSIEMNRPTLDDVFLKMTGRSLAGQQDGGEKA